jgi:acyl-coenzyme A thioesterase PaaI-like protein
MTLQTVLALPASERDPQKILDNLPYAVMMGIKAELAPGTQTPLRFWLDATETHMGNPTIPAMHGGAVSGLMEVASAVHLLTFMKIAKYPKLIDFTVDYLRAARLQTTHAACELIREGRTLTAVQVKAWQDDVTRPVAMGRAQFLCLDAD